MALGARLATITRAASVSIAEPQQCNLLVVHGLLLPFTPRAAESVTVAHQRRALFYASTAKK